jgi:hypothetical protein
MMRTQWELVGNTLGTNKISKNPITFSPSPKEK